MRLQFKHQKFQADAAKAVVDVFAGQPYLTAIIDSVKRRIGNLSHIAMSQTPLQKPEMKPQKGIDGKDGCRLEYNR